MNIVFSDSKTTILDTQLNEVSFSKIVNGLNFSEQGKHISFTLFSNDFNFSSWSFDGTGVNDSTSRVVYEYKGFGGNTGFEILTSKDEARAARFTYALITAISKAIETGHSLPSVGLGGILYKERLSKSNPSEYKIEFLFMPENLFENSALNLSPKDYSENQGYFQNKALSGNNSLIFLQSVTAYYALAKIFPFMKTETEKRQQDITDSNFILIENLVNDIDPQLAANINMGFHIDNQYEREKTLISAVLLKKALCLNDDGTYTKKEKNDMISKENFDRVVLEKQKAADAKAKRKRFFKRNMMSIAVTVVCMAIITNICYKNYAESLSKPSFKNIDSRQAIEAFYTGFHHLHTDFMIPLAKGSSSKSYISMISGIYVASTTRQAYEGKNSCLTPELYLTRPELMDYWIFGITDFKIDGTNATAYFTPETKYEINQLKKENRLKKFSQGQTERHEVSFRQISSSGINSDITITDYRQTVKCTYIKDQWYITDIDSDETQSTVNLKELLEDYKNEYLKNPDPIEIVKALREKYDWLPDDSAMQFAHIIAENQKNYFK